jgi:cobalt-zinc-cadmium efflux system protein
VILVAELAGGIMANSLALLADAGHVFADVIALSLSWYGLRQAERPASNRMTFGYHRVGVIIAIVNALSIFAIALFIFYEAIRRLQQPPEYVDSPTMLIVATIGLSVNLLVAFWLRKEQRANLNVRSAFWHSLGDALASIGVILGGIIILATGLFVVDPIISVAIGLIIVLAAWSIFRDGLRVLLEATPPQIDLSQMISDLKNVPGVKDVHDIHVWSITPQLHAMSCHVLIDDRLTSEAAGIRQKIEEILLRQYQIEHTTLQMECEVCDEGDFLCKLTFGNKENSDAGPPQSPPR